MYAAVLKMTRQGRQFCNPTSQNVKLLIKLIFCFVVCCGLNIFSICSFQIIKICAGFLKTAASKRERWGAGRLELCTFTAFLASFLNFFIIFRLSQAMVMLCFARLTLGIHVSGSLRWNTCPTTPCSSWCHSCTRWCPTSCLSRARPRTHGPMWMLTVEFCYRCVLYEKGVCLLMRWLCVCGGGGGCKMICVHTCICSEK